MFAKRKTYMLCGCDKICYIFFIQRLFEDNGKFCLIHFYFNSLSLWDHFSIDHYLFIIIFLIIFSLPLFYTLIDCLNTLFVPVIRLIMPKRVVY